MIEGISALSNLQTTSNVSSTTATKSTTQSELTDFQDTFQKALEELKVTENITIQDTSDLLSGTSTDLHTAMIDLEKADIALQLTMQIRNKVIDAYKEIMRMQF